MATAAPGWFERLLLPELNSMKGEIKAENARIEGLEGKMVGEFGAVRSEIRRLDEKMDLARSSLNEKIDSSMSSLNGKIDSVKAELEVRIDAARSELGGRIDSAKSELSAKIDNLDKRLDMAQRLAVVEAKLKDIDQRSPHQTASA